MRDAKGFQQALTVIEASLVTLSAAIASGEPASVEREAERASNNGVSHAALYEAVLQSYLFVGFPRTIEAFFAARPVLERLGASPVHAAPVDVTDWKRSGEALCRNVYGQNYGKLVETMRSLSPDLAAWMILEGYGKTLSRPALGPVEREYSVVATLTATRMWRQLRSHAIGAVNVGGTRAGVVEAIALCGPWAGGSGVAEALRVVGMDGSNARR